MAEHLRKFFLFVEQKKEFTQGYFQRSRQNKAPAQCIREDTEVVFMALHLVFPALRPMAPLSDDLCFFSLPASSHPTSSWVCIFHPEEAVSFSQPYLGEWVGSV